MSKITPVWILALFVRCSVWILRYQMPSRNSNCWRISTETARRSVSIWKLASGSWRAVCKPACIPMCRRVWRRPWETRWKAMSYRLLTREWELLRSEWNRCEFRTYTLHWFDSLKNLLNALKQYLHYFTHIFHCTLFSLRQRFFLYGMWSCLICLFTLRVCIFCVGSACVFYVLEICNWCPWSQLLLLASTSCITILK